MSFKGRKGDNNDDNDANAQAAAYVAQWLQKHAASKVAAATLSTLNTHPSARLVQRRFQEYNYADIGGR